MPRPAIPEAIRRRFDEVVDRMRALVPAGWEISVAGRSPAGGELRVRSVSGSTGTVTVLARKDLEPREVPTLPATDATTVVSARWLSPRTRELLRERGFGFLDSTGNVEVALSKPGLFIRTDGASRDPQPKPRVTPGLRGARVWALLRTLIEAAPPYGVSDLSRALELDTGYVSRVLQVLTDELLIERAPRGPVTEVNWEGVLRQLVSTYSVFDANTMSTWVASGGPDAFLRDLPGRRAGIWAVSGSFGSARIVPVAAPEVAIIYTNDPDRLARTTRLLPAKIGANVMLAAPYDPIVFTRTWQSNATTYASVAQLAADDLTGNGRMPAEGEALIAWMRHNEKRWRARSLTEPVRDVA